MDTNQRSDQFSEEELAAARVAASPYNQVETWRHRTKTLKATREGTCATPPYAEEDTRWRGGSAKTYAEYEAQFRRGAEAFLMKPEKRAKTKRRRRGKISA